MFKTIAQKTQKARAIAGATVATAKVLRREHKQINYMIKTCYPELTRAQRRDLANRLLAFKINTGLVHS